MSKVIFGKIDTFDGITPEVVALAACLGQSVSNRDTFLRHTLGPKIEKWADECPQDGKTIAVGTQLRVCFQLNGHEFEWFKAIIMHKDVDDGDDSEWILFFPDDNATASGFCASKEMYYPHDPPNMPNQWDFLIDPEGDEL
jgi:hypothetical protein